MRHLIWYGVVAVLAVAAAACATPRRAQGFDDEVVERLDETVARWAERADGGGLVVRVEGPAGSRTMAAGPRDLDGQARLSGDEAFRIGSITKMFTTTVALQLVEGGEADLDAPIADVVPDRAALFEYGDEVTLRQLLAHTAGLPEYRPHHVAAVLEDIDVDDGVAVADCGEAERRDLLAFAAGDDTVFEPGTDWEYSNTGFHLAGEVIEAVAGQPLEDVYRQRIFEPLGMDDSWLACRDQPRAELARGHHPQGAFRLELPAGGETTVDVTDVDRYAGAAGQIVSTAGDLTVFARALFAGELFDDDATLETMLEPGPNGTYALGVEVAGVMGHSGGLIGYNSRLTYDPRRDTVVVALHNATPLMADRAANKVRNVVPRPTGSD